MAASQRDVRFIPKIGNEGRVCLGRAGAPVLRQTPTAAASSAEADAQFIGLSPSDTTTAGRAEIIKTHFKRFRGIHRVCQLEACALARQIVYDAINQRRLAVEHDLGALEHRVSLKASSFFHSGLYRLLDHYPKRIS
jgi:hypothetical protein